MSPEDIKRLREAVLKLAEDAPGWCKTCGGCGTLYTLHERTEAADCPTCLALRTALAALQEAGDG